MRIGERDVLVPAGGAALVPRGTPHTYWNAQEEPTRYVLAMTPRIERLIAALHARGGGESVEDVFRASAQEPPSRVAVADAPAGALVRDGASESERRTGGRGRQTARAHDGFVNAIVSQTTSS